MSLKYPQTHTLGKHLYFDLDWGNAANTNGNASPSLKTQGFRQQRCCPYDLHLRPPAPGPPSQPATERKPGETRPLTRGWKEGVCGAVTRWMKIDNSQGLLC